VAAGAALTVAHGAASPVTVPCTDVIDESKAPLEPTILGAAMTPPRVPSPVAIPEPRPWRYWVKTPLLVRGGSPALTISVAPGWRSRAAIVWGSGHIGPQPSLLVQRCPRAPFQRPAYTWNVYAGGFFLRSRSACVPLEFSTAGRRTTVHVSIAGGC
jgi:hypothetical protein